MAGLTVAPLFTSQFRQSIFHFQLIGRLIDEAVASALFTTSRYESAESTYGACDGVPRMAKATVYDTQTEQEYCAKYFREVCRG